MRMRPYEALALAALAVAACNSAPPVPTSSDPDGKDLVEGAVVAATESAGGVRLYKIVHVDDLPEPLGYEYHLIAYDPKAGSFEEAARLNPDDSEVRRGLEELRPPDSKNILGSLFGRRG